MTTTTSNQAPLPAESTGAARFLTLDNRFLAPVLITLILLVGQLSFGILESYDRTVLAIASSIVMELFLGRLGHRQVAAPGERLHHRDQCRAS